MKELVVEFRDDGSVQAMHLDDFDLSFLGDKSVQRATEIKFDEDTQLWGLHLPILGLGGEQKYYPVESGLGFKSYEQARKFEVAWVNICRDRSEDIHGCWATYALHAARRHFGDDNPPTVEQFTESKCR